jgi:hypothetical protein
VWSVSGSANRSACGGQRETAIYGAQIFQLAVAVAEAVDEFVALAVWIRQRIAAKDHFAAESSGKAGAVQVRFAPLEIDIKPHDASIQLAVPDVERATIANGDTAAVAETVRREPIAQDFHRADRRH